MNQVEWCKAHGVNIHTFKYRLKVLKKEADQLLQNEFTSSKIHFAEIPIPIIASKQQSNDTITTADVTIITDHMHIQTDNSASVELVGNILKAVWHVK